MEIETKEELDRFYERPDPWDFQATKDDHTRRMIIARTAGMFAPALGRTLDIGAGEGWITCALPGRELHGLELSDRAASRFPYRVKRVLEPDGSYDLVVCSGVLYRHYDCGLCLEWIRKSSLKFVLTCHIKTWEIEEISSIGREIFMAEFPYREYVQKLRVFEVGK